MYFSFLYGYARGFHHLTNVFLLTKKDRQEIRCIFEEDHCNEVTSSGEPGKPRISASKINVSAITIFMVAL
ncbi:hypothetical protein WN51_06392 [Melipona quadrifasciata]|uniref:Uncharacterized protein n=1 Tax=Melipona quadrifasciata TaxID=166423 RepID=A0A0M9A9J2_9HYME|nr:hypothetical protein WN51_06392 [Melipona quadrifasciata]